MSVERRIAAFEGGGLRLLETGDTGREIVLALPLNRLLLRLVRVPAGEDPVEVSTPILKAASPFPDDPLTVGVELVREDASGKIVIAAALPEGAADDIGEALDAAKLNVVRIDSLVLGQLRGIWGALGEVTGRRMILSRSPDCLSIVILDGDQPAAIRAITDRSELRREVMLSLLEAEDFGGARRLEEIVVVETDGGGEEVKAEAEGESEGEPWWASLSSLAAVRTVTVGSDAALLGVSERSLDDGALNALPGSWREMLEETRFKRRLMKYVAIAGGVWLLVIAVMFGVPVGFDFATSRQKSLSKRHDRQYVAVKRMKEKVELIQTYSDHARGALEILKAVSDRLPPGITLSNWDYDRESGVRFTGETAVKDETYELKDKMDALASVDRDGNEENVFHEVELSGPNASRNGFKFTLDCRYVKEGEE